MLLKHPPRFSKSVEAVLERLPALEGTSIELRFRPELTAGARKLYSKRRYGQPVFAASYIRRRIIVLDQELQQDPRELSRILAHELFHFVWVRLGNRFRQQYEALLVEEFKQHARGELGWSAESRKAPLAGKPPAVHNARFLDYACESFCDTAAWLYAGLRQHPEFTLADRYRKRRSDWFHATFLNRRIPI